MSIEDENNRILIISGWYLPLIGGYIKVVHELALKLLEIGYNVDILTSGSEKEIHHEVIDSLNVYKIPSYNFINNMYPVPKINITNLFFIINLFKKKYRCIITNTRFLPICILGSGISFIYKIPLIHIEHGSCHTVIDNLIISNISKIFDHTLGTILIKSAKINVGVSKAAVTFLMHLGATNPILIYNSIDSTQYAEYKKNKPENSSLIVGYIGRLIYGKGIQDIISIFPKLPGNIQLLIIGDGPYKSKLKELICEIGASNIMFLGEVNPEKVPEILQMIDIFVNPSYSEGLPTSVLEACAAGCAVIASNVGGTGEIILDGYSGFLFQPRNRMELAEKLNLLITNDNIRNTIGINAQEYVRNNFSMDNTINKWGSIVEKIYE